MQHLSESVNSRVWEVCAVGIDFTVRFILAVSIPGGGGGGVLDRLSGREVRPGRPNPDPV